MSWVWYVLLALVILVILWWWFSRRKVEPVDPPSVALVQVQREVPADDLVKLEGWIEQAQLAAKGDWDGLERLQNELKGGRKQ